MKITRHDEPLSTNGTPVDVNSGKYMLVKIFRKNIS